MDRLSSLRRASLPSACIAALCALGCDEGGEDAPAPSRVEAVRAADTVDVSGFCDRHWAPGEGPALELPPLEGDVPSTGVRWVNVWATWCGPCVEELPLLARWQRELTPGREAFALALVSVDHGAEAVSAFRAAHAGTPPSARMIDAGAMSALTRGIGHEGAASLPLHTIVGADGRLLCTRAGALGPEHERAARAVVTSR